MTTETHLLAKIEKNSRLPTKKHNRYWDLRRKREEKQLTEAESAEYLTLIQEWEARNVERVRALISLAEKRGTTLRSLMAQLGLKGAEGDF